MSNQYAFGAHLLSETLGNYTSSLVLVPELYFKVNEVRLIPDLSISRRTGMEERQSGRHHVRLKEHSGEVVWNQCRMRVGLKHMNVDLLLNMCRVPPNFHRIRVNLVSAFLSST